MLCFFISLILYKSVLYVNENTRDFYFPFTFGFQNGGNYSINFFGNGTESYLFQIAPNKSINNYWIGRDLYHTCDNIVFHDNIHLIQLTDGRASFSGIIKNEGEYCVNIKSCNYFSSNYTIEISFYNPASCFERNTQTLIKKYSFIIRISITLFIFWIINWIQNFTLKNVIHFLITINFLIFIVKMVLYYNELQLRNQSDETPSIFYIRKAFSFFKYFTKYLVLFLLHFFYGMFDKSRNIKILIFGFIYSMFNSSIKTLFFSPSIILCYALDALGIFISFINFASNIENLIKAQIGFRFIIFMLISMIYLFVFLILNLFELVDYVELDYYKYEFYRDIIELIHLNILFLLI